MNLGEKLKREPKYRNSGGEDDVSTHNVQDFLNDSPSEVNKNFQDVFLNYYSFYSQDQVSGHICP